jgi:hypothetical protein
MRAVRRGRAALYILYIRYKNSFEKSLKIIWRFKKSHYLCNRFERETLLESAKKKVLKDFLKILHKRFGD